MNAKRALTIAAVVGMASAAAFYGHEWWTNGRFIEVTDDAYIADDVGRAGGGDRLAGAKPIG